jgi:uncharacterized protein (TIGR03437 family)
VAFSAATNSGVNWLNVSAASGPQSGAVISVNPNAGSGGDSVAGLLQVNAVVPQNVTPGAAVPIAISVGGVPSQGGMTIAIQ